MGDLFTPKPVRYWTEFLAAIVAGHVCYGVTRMLATGDVPALVPASPWLRYGLMSLTFVVGALLYYRSAMFIHELVHLRSGTFTGFRVAWNLLCGIPFFMPSFVYYTHLDHHRRKHYGTENDGEYLPLGRRGVGFLLLYMAQVLVAPPLVYLRFLVLTPLCWCVPAIRRFVIAHMSSMIIDPFYVRPMPTKSTAWIIRLQEGLVFLYALGLLVVPIVFLHRLPIPFFVQGYLTGVFILTIDHIRTLGAHRWENGDRREMTFVGQLLDSVNVPRWSLANELWGPVGLRFHALHHLLPSLPYHSMAEAHRRLMEHLPADSPYRQTAAPTLTAALMELGRNILAVDRGLQPGASVNRAA